MGGDRPTIKNEEAMFKVGPDVLPTPSRQARIQQHECELPDGKVKFVDLVLCFQGKAIPAFEPASSWLANVKGR